MLQYMLIPYGICFNMLQSNVEGVPYQFMLAISSPPLYMYFFVSRRSVSIYRLFRIKQKKRARVKNPCNPIHNFRTVRALILAAKVKKTREAHFPVSHVKRQM